MSITSYLHDQLLGILKVPRVTAAANTDPDMKCIVALNSEIINFKQKEQKNEEKKKLEVVRVEKQSRGK